MDCEQIRRLGLADEYRAGRLPPEEADAYEEHYYACPRCFEDLEFRDRVAGYLRVEGERLFAEDRFAWEEEAARRSEADLRSKATAEAPAAAPRRDRRRSRTSGTSRAARDGRRWWNLVLPGPSWSWGLALVVASVFVAALIGNRADQKDHLRRLAHVAPYPYVASELRAEETAGDFERAMELYKEGRHAEAAALLASCAREEPGDPDVHFYLGVSRLLQKRPREAATSLREAVRLAPASPVYRWHLVQALLCTGDRGAALRELNILAAGVDEYAAQARDLRTRVIFGE